MKPIAVLLLVLVAIAALIFGLITLSGGQKTVRVEPDQPVPAAPSAGQPPAEIEKPVDSGARTSTPTVAKAEDRTLVDPKTYQYANELRVQVLGDGGKPLPDAEVTLTTLSSNDLIFLDDARPPLQLGPQRTDREGRTSFVGLEPRSKYTLICAHPDYARQERDTVPVEQDGVKEEPPIQMTTGCKLSGYVKDEQGGPIAGALVVLEGMLAQPQNFVAPDRQEARTNAEGWYVIPNVAASSNARPCSATAPGFGRMIVGGLIFQKGEKEKSQHFVLKVAEQICGRVVAPGNKPLAGARVLAVGVNNTQQTAREETVSDDKGEFCFELLAPGEYNVVANLRGWRFKAQNRVMTNTANLVMEGEREASVCGQVVDAATGTPLTQFTCQMRFYTDPNTPTYPSPIQQSFSDAGGNFCLEGVQQGEYVVEAWGEGYAPSRSQSFIVSVGKDVQGVNVRVSRGGSISGRIVDPDGRPVSKARVLTRPNDWSDDEFTASIADMYPSHVTQVEARTATDGTFVLPHLSPDQYMVIVEGTNLARWARNEIGVHDGADTKLGDLQVARGGSVTGTVYDGTGKGVPGATVSLSPLDRQVLPTQYATKTGADGRYVIRNVANGRFMVRANRGGGPDSNPLEELQISRDSERQISVSDDQETKLDITIQK